MMPIRPREFAAWMEAGAPWHRSRRLAVAVSGGADSMALAWLLAGWGRPMALIVDHGLRAGSDAEARLTQQRLALFDVPGQVLTLLGLRRGAEAAREGRYAALLAACASAGLADLLVAQHAADQAETVLLREASGTHAAGRAGMACVSYRGPVRLVRPLLSVSPGRLRATLQAAGVEWVEDPSNQDLRNPRARLRQAGQLEPLPRTIAAGAARHAVEQAVAAELAANVSLFPDGFAHVSGPLSADALSALIWTLSGRTHPPAPAAVARLVPLRPGTLHGVQVAPAGRLGPGWLLVRERAALPAARHVVAGDRWDCRFRIRQAGVVGRGKRKRGVPALVNAGVPELDCWFDPARPMAAAPFASPPAGWGCTAARSTPCLTIQAASAHGGPGTRSTGPLHPRPGPGENDWIAGIT